MNQKEGLYKGYNFMEKTIELTKLFVKKTLKNAESGHDYFHAIRVYNNCKLISEYENVNKEVVYLSALLHDIADSKFHEGDEELGPKLSREFLENIHVDESTIKHVCKIIENISFKGGNFNKEFNSRELEVVQDADRLDAIGAIGIARTFNYGGYKNRTIFDPEIQPKLGMSKKEYKNHVGTTLNHFHEKLFLLKDLMNTSTGKRIAEDRHEFMHEFVKRFHDEWNGLN